MTARTGPLFARAVGDSLRHQQHTRDHSQGKFVGGKRPTLNDQAVWPRELRSYRVEHEKRSADLCARAGLCALP